MDRLPFPFDREPSPPPEWLKPYLEEILKDPLMGESPNLEFLDSMRRPRSASAGSARSKRRRVDRQLSSHAEPQPSSAGGTDERGAAPDPAEFDFPEFGGDNDDHDGGADVFSQRVTQITRRHTLLLHQRQWAVRRERLQARWDERAQGDTQAALATLPWWHDQHRAAIAARVGEVKRDHRDALPRIFDRCEHCDHCSWELGGDTFPITLLFFDFARKVDLPTMVCGACDHKSAFNPIYIGLFPSSATNPVCTCTRNVSARLQSALSRRHTCALWVQPYHSASGRAMC